MTIAIVIIIWLAITIFTPGKIRPFISSISGLVALVFVFNTWNSDEHEPMIEIPEQEGREAYEIKLSDFNALREKSEKPSLTTLSDLDSLRAKNKKLFTHEDLSDAQLEELKNHPQYEALKSGKASFMIRKVQPWLDENNVLQEGYEGIEFAELPYMDLNDTLKEKEDIIQAIRNVVSPNENPGNI